MMRKAFAGSALVAALVCPNAVAQSRETNFSGRWLLTALAAQPDEPEMLTVQPPDELLITQTPRGITIEHPSKAGTHPTPGTFEFGSGGWVGGVAGAASSQEGRWGTTFIGTQLMVSKSTITTANGLQTTAAQGSFWWLDERGRLVIEFREERSRERPKTATRIYIRK